MADDADARRRRVRLIQRYLVNPPAKLGTYLGLVPDHGLLETVGRRTGKRRRTVVGIHAADGAIWIVAEQGRHAGYVANLLARSAVRLRIGRQWYAGRASTVPDDDPQRRLDSFGRPRHAAAVRRFGTALLTVRVELDDSTASRDSATY